jgi:hypothetical protein
VVDCRDPNRLELRFEDLTGDAALEHTREIGAAAHAMNVEGLLVPSATLLGDNLILFPDQFLPTSQLKVLSSRDPRLYIDQR